MAYKIYDYTSGTTHKEYLVASHHSSIINKNTIAAHFTMSASSFYLEAQEDKSLIMRRKSDHAKLYRLTPLSLRDYLSHPVFLIACIFCLLALFAMVTAPGF